MSHSAPSDDPFVVVQTQVRNAWEILSAEYASCKSQNRSNDSDILHSRDRIKAQLNAIKWDLNDLDEALKVAKEEPLRFGLSNSQITARTQFLNEMRRKLQSVNDALQSDFSNPAPGNQFQTPEDTRIQLLTRRNNATTARSHQDNQENEHFINDEMEQQQIIMDRQDEELSALASAVERIGLMGHEMHQEFEQQNDMLEDLGAEMETTHSRMANARQKLDQFISETGPRQFCTILWLSIIFLVLTVLVVTT